MSALRHSYRLSGLLAAALLPAAALPGPSPRAELDLDTLLAPVIALEAQIPANARSAESLGTVRGGTGVVIDGAGLVLTIGYLILEAESVDLLPGGLEGPRLPADVVAWDQLSGLGLLRAREPLDIPPMPIGSAATLTSGDAVITVGWERADALLPSVVVERRAYAGYWEYLIEDALFVSPSHPSFPGAALITLDGKLAGIGGFVHSTPGDDYGIVDSVYVPIDALTPVLADLLLTGRSPQARAWLGLYCEEFDGELRVRRLPEDGPAARAGVLPGDYLLAVANTPVATLREFYRFLWATVRPGERVSVRLRRDKQVREVEIEAVDRYQWYTSPPPRP